MKKLILKYLNRETISYLICGVLTTAFAYSLYALFVYMNLSTLAANSISSVLAVIFAYIVNKIFVFRSLSWEFSVVLAEAAKFGAARAVVFFLETALLMLLIDKLGFNSYLMKGVTLFVVVVLNYVMSKLIVFRRK